jgi:serine/threonine protein kinase/tetratricopeptide (TPR) repeat protein
MGEVYRATDTKLGREVALKVLPAGMEFDPARLGRFQREARAIAALNHPHIVTIFSVEEAEGVHFLTMELVEGQALGQLIPAGGMPVARLVEIGAELADALSAAHAKGIVHRDLKPANVMLTRDGRVKVLDFGLAKELRAENSDDPTLTSAADRTKAGVVMGTPAYMSPEQIEGRTIDHRTDIFSLGVMLYEMAGGTRPFQGRSWAELAAAILRDTPRPLGEIRAELPGALGRVVQRCIEKRAEDRFASAAEVGEALRRVQREGATRETATTDSRALEKQTTIELAVQPGTARAEDGFWVAVLPFKYSGANPEVTALADGLTEDIITGLSRFSYLKVIARSSTLRYASELVDVRSAGKQLGARYVLEGSLRQAGTRLRVSAQLVDSSSGAHLWAETYDYPFQADAIFETQDDLVPRIVSTIADMNGILPRSMGDAVSSRDPRLLTPYEALLRSFAYYARFTPEEHAAARNALERAVQQATGHADCWAMLSLVYADEYRTGFNMRPDPLARGLHAARRAMEISPTNHLGPHGMAVALFFVKEMQAFHNEVERSLKLNSMDGSTLANLGMLTAFSGQWERGCAMTDRAAHLNPNLPGWHLFANAFDAYRRRDYEKALTISLKLNMRGLWGTNLMLSVSYGQLGEKEKAQIAVQNLLQQIPGFGTEARVELAKWWQPEFVEHLLEGLSKAGLEQHAA